MRIEIKGARLVDSTQSLDRKASLYVADGLIVAHGRAPDGFRADSTVDASGEVLCAGLVDLSARLREPGFEYKATLESELQAAVAGGVTSLACPPDTDPPLDEPGLVEMLKRRAESLKLARVYPLGALTLGLKGEKLTEVAELTEAGCIGFFQANHPIPDTMVLYRAMQYAATFGYTVWLHPEDPFLAAGGMAHDGETASRLGLQGIPASAETIALATILTLMAETGAKVHIARLSSAASVPLLVRARDAGLPITCDVGIHHLHLCDRDIGFFDPQCRFVPPLRDVADRAGLRKALEAGVIDAACSDHTPVDEDAKQVPFGEAEPGATGLELLLPLTLKWAGESGLPLGEALATVTSRPARVLGLDAGTLAPGRPADLCLFDPAAPWRVRAGTLASQGKNSPFLGLELQGRVTRTFVSGIAVFVQPG
jgi:dihydroorotase